MVKNGEKQQPLKNNSKKQQLFLGEYQPNITGGARMALPKKIREVVGEDSTVILSRGFETCIAGYTLDYWEEESNKALNSSLSDKKSRLLKRYMFSGAFEIEYDSQGRVVIPKSLLDYSGIGSSSEVILVGAGDHFEIWNKEKWEELLSDLEEQID